MAPGFKAATSVLGRLRTRGLPGDYNVDGTAADIIWRRHEGTTTTLPNDPYGGSISTNK